MAAITTLKILIFTADESGAGTDGDVYVGCFGREFYLDTSADDFERGSQRIYTLGAGANTSNASMNDPRHPPLRDDDTSLPAYIRFVGKSRGDNWKLAGAAIQVNANAFPTFQMLATQGNAIWMGTRATGIVFIPRHLDAPTGVR